MKIYTIIGGVNGCGKSSLTGALKAERNDLGQIVDVDKIAATGNLTALEAGKVAVRKIKKESLPRKKPLFPVYERKPRSDVQRNKGM